MTRSATGRSSPGRVRVLFVIDSLGPGGAERTLRRVVELIDQTVFECRVAVLQVREGNPMADEIRVLGVPVDQVRVDRLRSVAGQARFLRYLLAYRPSIIHTHLEFSHTLGGIYGRLVGAGPIATIHTFALGRASREKKRLGLMWFSLRAAHIKVVAPSRAGMAHAVTVGRIPAERMVVLHNGVDLEAFKPDASLRAPVREELGIPFGSPLLITVAILRSGKGTDDLVSAMPEILDSIPDAMALIVGDGDQRVALERLAGEAGVAERVVFTGSRDDVGALLAASDVFVLPTHVDLLPTVVAEAMAAGLPVVASDVGGLGDMVEDDVTGILYPAGDIEALTRACVGLLADPRRRDTLGRSGRLVAEEKFDIRKHVEALQRLYLELRRG
jgi:glycosyltransferase involved in cell wall biosynthesis